MLIRCRPQALFDSIDQRREQRWDNGDPLDHPLALVEPQAPRSPGSDSCTRHAIRTYAAVRNAFVDVMSMSGVAGDGNWSDTIGGR